MWGRGQNISLALHLLSHYIIDSYRTFTDTNFIPGFYFCKILSFLSSKESMKQITEYKLHTKENKRLAWSHPGRKKEKTGQASTFPLTMKHSSSFPSTQNHRCETDGVSNTVILAHLSTPMSREHPGHLLFLPSSDSKLMSLSVYALCPD